MNSQKLFGLSHAEFWVLVIGTLVLSYGQASIFLNFHAANLHDLAMATVGFFNGETHWRTFQNRIIGPALVDLFTKLGKGHGEMGGYVSALKFYYYISTHLTNLVFLYLLLRFRKGFVLSALCQITFVCAQMMVWTYWFYPWDPIELVLFSILLLGDVRQKRGLGFFYLLFAFWVFSKETALFLPFYLVLSRAEVPENWRKPFLWMTPLNRKLVLHAGLLFVAGVAIIKTLRDTLFVHSVLIEVGADESHRLLGQQNWLIENLGTLGLTAWNLIPPHIRIGSYGEIFGLALIVGVFYAVWRLYQMRDAVPGLAWRLVVLGLVYVASIVFGGRVAELRVYLPLIPLSYAIVFLLHDAHKKRGA